MKFLHAADLHIDSPLKGLELLDGAPADRLRRATRDALSNLVELAMAEEVALVLIAGDLFDGEWPDMRTGLWAANQFRRLGRAGIPVCLIRGNHDAVSVVRKQVTWPENVTELSVRAPETFTLERCGLAVHGQGFAHRKCEEDLVARYPRAVGGLFNIGVLHTSLAGYDGHDTYAPTRATILEGKGYDYWALGHIHQRQRIPSETAIHYCGNTQGRHARETGPKGCLLVTVDDLKLQDVEFRPLDTVRWHALDLPLCEDDHLDELYSLLQSKLAELHEGNDGRFCAVRLTVRGACEAHRAISNDGQRAQVLAEIKNIALDFDDGVWIEKVLLETSSPIDLEQLRQASDLMGDLLRMVQQIETDETELVNLATRELAALTEKAPQELADAGLDLADPHQLRRWLRQAEGLLVTKLVEDP